MTQDVFIKEFSSMPEQIKQEVIDFFLFLKEKQKKQNKGLPTPKFGYGKVKGKLAEDFDAPMMLVDDVEANKASKPKPYFGCGAVKFTISPDFDEPLEDFKEYME